MTEPQFLSWHHGPSLSSPVLLVLSLATHLSSQVVQGACHTRSQPCAFFTFTRGICLENHVDKTQSSFCKAKYKLSFKTQPGCHLQ